MRVVAIVQARMGSTRLPNKVMQIIGDVPMIELLILRLARSKELDKIVVATTVAKENALLKNFINKLGFVCERGDENDVLSRYIQAAKKHKADIIVRITGDCPLVDPILVDECVRRFKETGVDYLCNRNPPTFPDGLDVEIIFLKALEICMNKTDDPYDREHVTPYITKSGIFKIGALINGEDLSKFRWTVDEKEDLEVIRNIFEHFSPNIYFSWRDVLDLQKLKPQLFLSNSNIKRNEGAQMGTGQKLWRRAKWVIPGGNMLLSKRAEMFLPEHWPSYFSKAKGCKVWSLDGKEYLDMSLMGVGTNTLGYGNYMVDDAVHGVVASGNMSTLNCPEEVYLAERLIELHPWAEMVKLARTGGEANAIAIRIARAASGKQKVAFCGYHGWHDWYLSANLGKDDSLSGHLLSGLEPIGVPKNLCGTALPFKYNDFGEIENLIKTNDIGTIIMEVSRSHAPAQGYLQHVRNLATKNNIVLIFDECTSGFRQCFGGLHKFFNVEPDISIFGKALGNGYAITAVIGRRSIMESAQSTFISSTFWTERIGPVAGLKTLEVMEATNSWKTITNIGEKVKNKWMEIAKSNSVEIIVNGIPALANFNFVGPNTLIYKTFLTQYMLDQGILATTQLYASTSHEEKNLDKYFLHLDAAFKLIAECENDTRSIKSLLRGPICHSGFKRLN